VAGACTILGVYIRFYCEAAGRRAVFRSYIDLVIRAVNSENANTLAIASTYDSCIKIKAFDKKCSDIRPDIWSKGIFDAACDAVKKVSFIGYGDTKNNPLKKAELLKHLQKVRSLAW